MIWSVLHYKEPFARFPRGCLFGASPSPFPRCCWSLWPSTCSSWDSVCGSVCAWRLVGCLLLACCLLGACWHWQSEVEDILIFIRKTVWCQETWEIRSDECFNIFILEEETQLISKMKIDIIHVICMFLYVCVINPPCNFSCNLWVWSVWMSLFGTCVHVDFSTTFKVSFVGVFSLNWHFFPPYFLMGFSQVAGVGEWCWLTVLFFSLKDRCSAQCSGCCPDVSMFEQCFRLGQLCDCELPSGRSCWPQSCSPPSVSTCSACSTHQARCARLTEACSRCLSCILVYSEET